MPYIDLKTNVSVNADTTADLQQMLGREIELIPGKSERWLMLNFTEGCRMAFAASSISCSTSS